jgi:tRNA(Ile)-lysidine synthase
MGGGKWKEGNRMKKPAEVPQIVERFIRKKNLLEPGGKVLAAVSGGADSLCLLLVLKELGYGLRVAHFDHALRPESAGEAEFVRRASERLGVPLTPGQGDVRGHAERRRLTIEEAARDLRYDFLLRAGREAGAAAVATGHTMNDQAETVLMNLVRGSGMRGLGGIRPVADFPRRRETAGAGNLRLVRPLLCLTHAQTAEFCRRAGWTPLEDPSNQDTTFTRNKIRHEWIPLLEKYNESFVKGLFRLSDIAQAQEDFIEMTADGIWNRSAESVGPGWVRIPRTVFREAPAALQQALVRRAIRETAGDLTDLAYRHVVRVMEFLDLPTASRRMDLALGVEVSLENEWLVFRSPARIPISSDWEEVELPFPGWISIHAPDWRFEILEEVGGCRAKPQSGPDPWAVWIDPDCIRPPLILRKRKPGDIFLPSGMENPVKVSDFLASHHLPLSERDRWPLVCDAEGIIWIPGLRAKKGISPSDRSVRRVWIHIQKNL